jgi:hypothetical protein
LLACEFQFYILEANYYAVSAGLAGTVARLSAIAGSMRLRSLLLPRLARRWVRRLARMDGVDSKRLENIVALWS